MSEHAPYPQPPWQPIAALIIALATLYGNITLWKPHLPLLQREYFWSYFCLSLHLPQLHRQQVVMNGEHLATLQESGTFHHEERKIADQEKFRAWLQANIYEGKAIWWFALIPEILTLLIAIPAFGFALWHLQTTAGEMRDGRLLRGPRMVSHWQFNGPLLFKKKERGFYIETK